MAGRMLPDMPALHRTPPTTRWIRRVAWSGVLAVMAWLCPTGAALSATYISASTTYRFIDSSTHTKVGYNTSPYKFNAAAGCGTSPPVLDDTLSSAIPIGFTFKFGAASYTSAYIMTNGRLQFGNTLCGAGTATIGPPQTYPYGFPNPSANRVMKIFGVDLDPTNLVDIPNYPSSTRKTPCASSSTCYISYATLGTSPTRQFVVTWKNVPEWVSATNTSGSFDLQILLNEDGSFVYQYGNIVHGGTGTAEIGWQLTTGDYEVLKFGAASEPPPNTAIAFFVPTVLASWAFDEGAWASGAAGQVRDSGAKALHGVAVGAAQTIADGKVCRGGNVPLNTSAGRVDAIRLGASLADASLNLSGTGTLAFWYRSRVAWSSAADGQLVDASTRDREWFSLARVDGGKLAFVVTDSTGDTKVVESGKYGFAAGTWVHIAIAWNYNAWAGSNQDGLTVYVNGTPTTVSFTSAGTLPASAGYLYLGDNPSGYADSKGSVNSADGDFDEVQLYNYVIGASQVGVLMAATRPCTTLAVHHIEIQHATGVGLTCTPTVVTLKACADVSCSATFTGGLSGTVTATGSVAAGFDPSATFSIGAGSDTTQIGVQLLSPGSSLLGVSGVSVAVTSTASCTFGSPACTLTAVDAGLVLSVADHVSDTPATLRVGAVRKSDQAQVCVPAFANVTRNLVFTCGYQNPATGTRPLLLAGTALNAGSNPAAACDTSGRAVPVAFDGDGVGSLAARYADVGRVSVAARYTGTSGAESGLVLQGSTSVVVAPASFSVAVDAAPFVAGAAFAATVTALNASGAATPNFGLESTPQGVTLSWARRSPIGAGAADGSFSGSVGAFAVGAARGSDLVWTEVGTGDLLVALRGANYLGSGLTAGGSTGTGGAIGPFKPHRLSTAATEACGTFSYGGQPFSVAVTARNALGGVTLNYDGSAQTVPNFARTTTLSDGSGNVRGTLAGSVDRTSFLAGVGRGLATYTFLDKLTGPQTPSVRAVDTDGVSSAGGAEGSTTQRSGRLRLANTFGSERADLLMPVMAEFHSGAAWVINAADSCTAIPAAAVALSNRRSSTGAATSAWTNSVGAVAVAAGHGTLRLSPPTPSATGSVDVALNLGTTGADASCLSGHPASSGAGVAWLRSRNGSCASSWDRDPAARAAFGVYSPESSRTIHARDLY